MKGKKDMVIDNVKTRNFPFEVIDGEEHYPLHSAAVIESITGQIPDEVKPSVTIDYDQIPEAYFKRMKLELGIRSVDPKQASHFEQRLLETLDQEGAFTK
ncbi:hypothetical protein [Paenibacillus sp. IHB B 3084]|uniref:hypothetical protein n=1 Tax=Paenibacillus sp. IHB B 3084 TaxID=867076 RepID=UPI00107196EC|nr:hypothetical protein [Paenibacillus sp. IHB B 3084]